MRTLILLCFLPLCYCILSRILGRMQAVGVKGKLRCNDKPAAGVKIKLYEKEVLFDRKLDQVYTDSDGSFTVSGYAKEVTDIDPQINIYHRCNYRWLKFCCKKFDIEIPKYYIASGKIVRQYFNIGTLELGRKISGQTIDCIN